MKIFHLVLATLPLLVAAVEEPLLVAAVEEPLLVAADEEVAAGGLRRLSYPYIKYRGNNGHPSSAYPLGRCEGDCDNDHDCEHGLKCFQRGAGKSVPSCRGGSSDHSLTDYCIKDDHDDDDDDDHHGKLGRCEGDCDSDSDCDGSYVCFQRHSYECVPGCKGDGKKGTDYCIDKNDKPTKSLKYVSNHRK